MNNDPANHALHLTAGLACAHSAVGERQRYTAEQERRFVGLG